MRAALSDLKHPPLAQISFLDGLRSAAILLVISGHVSKVFSDTYGSTLYSRLPFVANGWIGVDLFFVLSGFFIGAQLWREIQRDNTLDVQRFVLRRGFRIWPLYFFMFLAVFAISIPHGSGLAVKQYGWSDLLFVTNLYNHGIVQGSWSLCTEEQFYIVTPVALLFLMKAVGRIERCRPWLWVLLAAMPLLRSVLWVHAIGHFFRHDPAQFSRLYYSPITHCDGLVMGVLIANAWISGVTLRGGARPWLILGGSGILMVLSQIVQKEILDFTALAVLFGAITWVGLHRNFKMFNSRVFYWLSRLSFGMYLNHEYLAPWVVRAILPRMPIVHSLLGGNLIAVALVVIMSAAAALVTFCLVEYPFLQLRSKLLSRQKPARHEVAVTA